jgi:hypothetical protein
VRIEGRDCGRRAALSEEADRAVDHGVKRMTAAVRQNLGR